MFEVLQPPDAGSVWLLVIYAKAEGRNIPAQILGQAKESL